MIDWELIERHSRDPMQVTTPISAGRLSSAHADAPTAVQLPQEPHLQGLPQGRPLRTHGRAAALPGQPAASRPDHGRDQQGKSYNGFAHWLSFGNNGVLANNDPCEQEKLIKPNTLLANLAIFHNTRDIMDVVRQLVAEGWSVTADQLPALSPYLRLHITRLRRLRHRRTHHQPEALNPC
ncbi:Tn3 family transposase [Actinomadura coerulea]